MKMTAKRKMRTTKEILQDQKEQAEKSTALANARPASALVADGSNPWLEIGAELDRFILAPLLKFSKQGEFAVNDVDNIPEGVRCVAHADEITLGWVKWVDGRPEDPRTGRIADKFTPPQRSELDDNDSKQWEVQDDGTHRDPWQFQMSVPVTRLDTQETFRFISASKGGLACIGKLVKAFGRRVQEGKGGLPVVELKADHYKHRKYGKIFTPSMIVISWTDEGGKPQSLAKDMNDGIGF
jgi:hypothetical protein